MKVRRLFTEADMADAFFCGYAAGWVRTFPANMNAAVVEMYRDWMEKKFPEGCEAELRAKETQTNETF